MAHRGRTAAQMPIDDEFGYTHFLNTSGSTPSTFASGPHPPAYPSVCRESFGDDHVVATACGPRATPASACQVAVAGVLSLGVLRNHSHIGGDS
jgi:hypothetical protein